MRLRWSCFQFEMGDMNIVHFKLKVNTLGFILSNSNGEINKEILLRLKTVAEPVREDSLCARVFVSLYPTTVAHLVRLETPLRSGPSSGLLDFVFGLLKNRL